MESSKLGNLTRIGSHEILSCTLLGLNEDHETMRFLDINFRQAVEKVCGILFYEYQNELYYPVAMEFRLIDNNVLFLLNELGIDSFFELSQLLKSSFKREEEREVEFFAIIKSLDSLPKFSQKIEKLHFSTSDKVLRV
ncbi:MAG: hypothetical protein VYA54_08940 [Bdellovibrionota bacterium]|nr:hypothetical protein [Bdellovibrionota bacterium]